MDIFDKIMNLALFRKINPFYKKYKEQLLYLLFGGLTTVISIVSFWLFGEIFKLNELYANIISWILSVTFAFFTNKIWVFGSSTNNSVKFIKQLIEFFLGRLSTLAVEELIIFVFITKLSFNKMIVKIVAQVVIIVLNYILSKIWIFKND